MRVASLGRSVSGFSGRVSLLYGDERLVSRWLPLESDSQADRSAVDSLYCYGQDDLMIIKGRQGWLKPVPPISLLMLTAVAVASCDAARGVPIKSDPSPSATASVGSPAGAGGTPSGIAATEPCALVTAKEVGESVGLPTPMSVGDGPTDCIFLFTPLGQTSAESVSVFLTNGRALVPSGTPVPDLGEAAGWSESSSQLQVQLPHALMSIYVQLPAKVPQQQPVELAIRIFKLAEPRVS
ncbi:hypothetical protein GCM10027259_13540 [Micromonospora palomenae]